MWKENIHFQIISNSSEAIHGFLQSAKNGLKFFFTCMLIMKDWIEDVFGVGWRISLLRLVP